MTSTRQGSHFVIDLGKVFRVEIREARQLGYTMQANVSAIAAVVRLIPSTQRTKHLALTNGASAIEATVPYTDSHDRLDAIRSAITSTVQMARDAAA